MESASFQRDWAKDEIMDAVDAFITHWKQDHPGFRVDEVDALNKQRNRIAKLFHKNENYQ